MLDFRLETLDCLAL